MDYPFTPPTEFRAGETVVWKMYEDADFPQASGWAAKATITGSGGNVTITATYLDGVWTFTLTAALNVLVAGEYLLYVFMSKGSGAAEETYPMNDGASVLSVLAKLSASITTDVRTHAQKMLTLIETALEAFATDQAIQTAEIAGRSYSRTEMPILYGMRSKYRRLVKGNKFSTIPVTF